MSLFDVLIRPIVTEQSTLLQERGKYVFQVQKSANKADVKAAVEMAFEVTVLDDAVPAFAPGAPTRLLQPDAYGKRRRRAGIRQLRWKFCS